MLRHKVNYLFDFSINYSINYKPHLPSDISQDCKQAPRFLTTSISVNAVLRLPTIALLLEYLNKSFSTILRCVSRSRDKSPLFPTFRIWSHKSFRTPCNGLTNNLLSVSYIEPASQEKIRFNSLEMITSYHNPFSNQSGPYSLSEFLVKNLISRINLAPF